MCATGDWLLAIGKLQVLMKIFVFHNFDFRREMMSYDIFKFSN
jgi:hypothetical protein